MRVAYCCVCARRLTPPLGLDKNKHPLSKFSPTFKGFFSLSQWVASQNDHWAKVTKSARKGIFIVLETAYLISIVKYLKNYRKICSTEARRRLISHVKCFLLLDFYNDTFWTLIFRPISSSSHHSWARLRWYSVFIVIFSNNKLLTCYWDVGNNIFYSKPEIEKRTRKYRSNWRSLAHTAPSSINMTLLN